jgi:hypothetical protein
VVIDAVGGRNDLRAPPTGPSGRQFNQHVQLRPESSESVTLGASLSHSVVLREMPSCEQRDGAVTAEKVASNRTQASLRPRRLVGGAMSPHSSPSVFPGEKEREKRVPTSASASPRRSGHPLGSDGTNTDTNDTATATDNVDTTPKGPEAVGWGWQAVGWWQYGAVPATGAATRSVVVGLLYAALGLGSAVLTSGPVAWMLWIAPHSTFGVRLVAVIVHLCFLAATYLGHALNVPR